MEAQSDTDAVAERMRAHFPDFHLVIEEFVLGRVAYSEGLDTDWRATVDAWAWISEVFNPEILKPALTENRGEELVRRVASFLEELIALRRSTIDDLIVIRVVDHLLGYPAYWQRLRPAAGPLLLAMVSEQQQYYRGPL
jgi:hypothetical protein